jgi:hypothetical protein
MTNIVVKGTYHGVDVEYHHDINVLILTRNDKTITLTKYDKYRYLPGYKYHVFESVGIEPNPLNDRHTYRLTNYIYSLFWSKKKKYWLRYPYPLKDVCKNFNTIQLESDIIENKIDG